MGCGSSKKTTVQQLVNENERIQSEAGNTIGDRENSAISKGTTDSGVEMEHKDIPLLPGVIPQKDPPVSPENFSKSQTEDVAKDAAVSSVIPGLLQQDVISKRRKSREIFEELLSQGIIPVGQSRDELNWAAYSITLNSNEGAPRRPPARLESLKTKKTQGALSKAEIDEKMRLVEERRKFKEETLKSRLRTMSARGRVPTPISGGDHINHTHAVHPDSPLTPKLASIPEHLGSGLREAPDGGEWIRPVGGEEFREKVHLRLTGKDEDNLTVVQELKAGELLSTFGDLEIDSSFQQMEDNEDNF